MTAIGRVYHIPVLCKALDVLEWLQARKKGASLEEIYNNTGISKSTIYRILRTLEHRGYLAHLEDGRYRFISRPSKLCIGFAGQSEALAFSRVVTKSLRDAAAASGMELMVLDNEYDPQVALANARRLIEARVDLAIEFQVDQSVAPIIGDMFATAGIPLVAVEIPHPHSIFFGVDNYRAGFAAGTCLAAHAAAHWQGKASWVLGLDIQEAGAVVQGRITGAFEAMRQVLPDLPAERYVRVDGKGLSERSEQLTRDFLQTHPRDGHILIAAADDTSALGALHAVQACGRESDVAIVGQDCIAEALQEMSVPGTPFIASISHEAHTYGPRLVQLALSMIRGQHVAPYHYVDHKPVLAGECQSPD